MNLMDKILSMVAAVVLLPLLSLAPGTEESSPYGVQTSLSDSKVHSGKVQNEKAVDK